jgi:hypothetical protein
MSSLTQCFGKHVNVFEQPRLSRVSKLGAEVEDFPYALYGPCQSMRIICLIVSVDLTALPQCFARASCTSASPRVPILILNIWNNIRLRQ